MRSELAKNHFELFGLPVSFEVDAATLASRYRELQRTVHPDKFASASDGERRLSVQRAAQVNEAFQTLREPLARARYLLQLHGQEPSDTDTQMDPAFLMEQMELRERLAELRGESDPLAALAEFTHDVERRSRALVDELKQLFAGTGESALQQAGDAVRKLQFLDKLQREAQELEEDLIDNY